MEDGRELEETQKLWLGRVQNPAKSGAQKCLLPTLLCDVRQLSQPGEEEKMQNGYFHSTITPWHNIFGHLQ